MDTIVQSLPLVREYYANKEIFVTGGTGFLGKVLIEKLLRSCPDVKRIYVLIRAKKGHSPADRLKLFTQDQVFDRLRKEAPDALQKIACCSGDVSEIGLGINPVDFERIRKCSIVIHTAATVRFDELLTDSLLMNTRGTRETLLLAQRMGNVEIFNHVSTTFCNPEYPDSEEKLYPVHVYWKDAIKLAENLDPESFETVAKLYMEHHHPNTYTFSKRLSEQLVNDFRKSCGFPVVILRPSVVTPTIEEPFPGWLDNFNGPTGIVVAGGTGIHRFINATKDNNLDYQPVDVVAKSIILSTWKEANMKTDLAEDVPIYNSSSFGKYTVCYGDLYRVTKTLLFKAPLLKTLWYPGLTFIPNPILYAFMTIICIAIPVNIIDFLARLLRLKVSVQLGRVCRKIFFVTGALQHFMNNNMSFNNTRCISLDKDLHPEEYLDFRQDSPVHKFDYLLSSAVNARFYLMKDDPSTIPAAKRNIIFLFIIHYALLAVVCGSVLYLSVGYLRNTTLYNELWK